MRNFWMIAAALLCAAPALAQQPRGFTLEEVEELLRNDVASDRVLQLARERCIHFIPDREALARVAAAGGTPELREGLRSPAQCSTREVAREPAPPPPDSAAAPELAPTHAEGSFVVGYNRNHLRLDGEGDGDTGEALALELAAGGSRLVFFVRADWVEMSPGGRPDFSVVNADLGARLYLLPPGYFVRPYGDVAYTYTDVTYPGGQSGGNKYTLAGWGRSAAGGVVLGTRNLGLDISYRFTAVKLGDLDEDGETVRLDDPVRGRSTRLVVGLRISGYDG